jgi:hypothetical protein
MLLELLLCSKFSANPSRLLYEADHELLHHLVMPRRRDHSASTKTQRSCVTPSNHISILVLNSAVRRLNQFVAPLHYRPRLTWARRPPSSQSSAPNDRALSCTLFSLMSSARRRSLPRHFDSNRDASDPHEKADRHSRHRSTYSDAFMNEHKGSAVMNQGQRLRYLKTGGIIAFILLVIYFVAPRHGISRPGGTLRPRYSKETG